MPSSQRSTALRKLSLAQNHLDKSIEYLYECMAIYAEAYPSIAHPIAICLENLELVRGFMNRDDLEYFLVLENTLRLIRDTLTKIKAKI